MSAAPPAPPRLRLSGITKIYPSVDALYDGSTHRHIETQVRFEDGRTGVVAADLAIVEARTFPAVRDAA